MFGPDVKNYRRRNLLTQASLAERAGVTAASISAVERGGGSLATLQRLLCELQLSVCGLPEGRNLGERIRAARNRRGWSRRLVAQKAGLTHPTLANIEDHCSGRVGSLEAVLRVLGVSARLRYARRSHYSQGRTDGWNTSADFMARVHSIVPTFDLDPCSASDSHVVARTHYYESDDGLSQSWFGTVWMNPPYSNMEAWVRKAFRESLKPETILIVGLLPVRSNTAYFHDCILGKAKTILLKGRLKFGTANVQAPFASMLALWGEEHRLISRFVDEFSSNSQEAH